MIWLTWRQFRVQGAVLYAAVAAVAVTVAVTAAGVANLSDETGTSFLESLGFDNTRTVVYAVGFVAVTCLPALVGIFWGAQLVARELEAGTHRLAWNQSVTRARWLATKLALVGLAAVAGAALLSLLMTWWCSPIDDAINGGQQANGILGRSRMTPLMFASRGLAPIGYTAFAFALGVTAGIVIRRSVPAMAVTLAVFVAVQVAVPNQIRPHLGQTTLTSTITADNLRGLMVEGIGPDGPVRELHVAVDAPGAWITADQTLDRSGKVVDQLPSWVAYCTPRGAMGPRGITERSPACFQRLEREGYKQRVTYTPADRSWSLQAIELGLFLVLTAFLIGLSFTRLRRLS